MRIWRIPCLVGWYCSYLLPKQALAPQVENNNKTWQVNEKRCTGWPWWFGTSSWFRVGCVRPKAFRPLFRPKCDGKIFRLSVTAVTVYFGRKRFLRPKWSLSVTVSVKNWPLLAPFGEPAVIPVPDEIQTSLLVAFWFRPKGKNPFW